MSKKNKLSLVVLASLAVIFSLSSCVSRSENTESPLSSAPVQPSFIPSISSQPLPPEPVLKPYVLPLSTDGFAYFALKENGALLSWGDNQFGTVGGNSPYTTYHEPYQLMKNIVSVSVCQCLFLAVDSNGVLWGRGSDVAQRVGSGVVGNKPIKIMEHVVMASAGNRHCLALKEDGSVWSWGFNYQGQLGNESIDCDKSTYITHSPEKVMDNAIFVATSGDSSFAISRDGEVFAWGTGTVAVQGNEEQPVLLPTEICDNALFVYPSNEQLYVIKKDKTLWLFEHGQNSEPRKLLENVKFCGYGFAVQEDGRLWTWGSNQFGELGDGTTTERDEPVKIMDHVVFAARGEFYTLMITNQGELLQAGYNEILDGHVSNEDLTKFYFPHKIMDGMMSVT